MLDFQYMVEFKCCSIVNPQGNQCFALMLQATQLSNYIQFSIPTLLPRLSNFTKELVNMRTSVDTNEIKFIIVHMY